MDDKFEIKINFTVKNNKQDYLKYQSILEEFEQNLYAIGIDDIDVLEKEQMLGVFYNEDGSKRTINLNDLVGHIVEINPTDDDELANFLDEIKNKYSLDSVFILVTEQEDDNLWGNLIGLKESLDFHFEVKDIIDAY